MHRPCRSLPQIKDFIEKKSSQYKNLKIDYSYGSTPKLRLKGGPGGASETLRIDNWKQAALEEFLNDRLASAS